MTPTYTDNVPFYQKKLVFTKNNFSLIEFVINTKRLICSSARKPIEILHLIVFINTH